MASRKFLITASTGKQSRAVINALLNAPTTPKSIFAITRNPDSPSAQSLASKPGITVVQGDPTSPDPIFAKTGPVDGMFLVTVPGKEGDEEKQAYPMIDAAVAQGVEHIVFTSVDRGGPASDTTPTNIPHFASKHRIEQYLKEKCASSKTSWTILRPVAFMDNFVPGFMGKGFASMWAGLGSKPLQLISTKDIGAVAAMALMDPEKYKSKAVGLAGDSLNFEQGKVAFKDAVGSDMPETFRFVGTALKWAVSELGVMFAWFEKAGYDVDIKDLRENYHPQLQDFKTWLKEDSGFKSI